MPCKPPFYSIQFSGLGGVHRVVWPSNSRKFSSNSRTFSSLKKKPWPPRHQSLLGLSYPSPWQPLVCFLSLDFPVLEFHVNEVTLCMALCDWCFSLRIMYPRFIHVVALMLLPPF